MCTIVLNTSCDAGKTALNIWMQEMSDDIPLSYQLYNLCFRGVKIVTLYRTKHCHQTTCILKS